MRARRLAAAPALAALVACAGLAGAQPVADPAWLWFPGELRHPSTAVSAGRALADRWLGDAPFENPAIAPRREAALSAAMVRVSRQDLRANNREVDETPAFFDAAGSWAGIGSGRLALFAYADQPLLRLEASAFTIGRIAASPGTPSGDVRLDLASRELRFGAGASCGAGPWRAGVAAEWTRRSERQEITVTSGAPTGNGTSVHDLSGDGFGGQAGLRLSIPVGGPDGATLGAAIRWRPEESISGGADAITRGSGWEAGLSARARAGDATQIFACFGGGGASEWNGLGVTTGASSLWGAAIEYHDREDPWTIRFGLGQEQQDGVPESRAGRVGLGFSWAFGTTMLDVGAMRRNLERSGVPDSYDDRVIATVRFGF